MYTKRVPNITEATMEDLGWITDHLLVAITGDHPVPETWFNNRPKWQNALTQHLEDLTTAIQVFKRRDYPDYQLTGQDRIQLAQAQQSLLWVNNYSEFILTLPHWTEEPTH